MIAATNRDLGQMVEERRFRADLYYRLNVFPITLPPLRERGEDIPLLIEHFVRKFAERQGKPVLHIPDEVMDDLKRYEWPGNIRELQNVMERAVIMTSGPELSRQITEDLRSEVRHARLGTYAEDDRAPVRTLAEAQRAHIMATLRETRGVIGGPRGAAAHLGLPRTTLIARMARLGICNVISGRQGQAIAAGA